jgi:hypothetical protein
MVTTVGTSLGGAGECNEGCLRDDALLVVVLVAPSQDATPDTSSGDVAAWRQTLAAAKHGHEGNVVVLALTGDGDLDQPLCSTPPVGPLPAQLRELTDAMPHAKWASTCLPDYASFFAAAADVVDAACDDFHPEG